MGKREKGRDQARWKPKEGNNNIHEKLVSVSICNFWDDISLIIYRKLSVLHYEGENEEGRLQDTMQQLQSI